MNPFCVLLPSCPTKSPPLWQHMSWYDIIKSMTARSWVTVQISHQLPLIIHSGHINLLRHIFRLQWGRVKLRIKPCRSVPVRRQGSRILSLEAKWRFVFCFTPVILPPRIELSTSWIGGGGSHCISFWINDKCLRNCWIFISQED
jgi:hypothetical protein